VSNVIRFDPLLVRHLATELHGRLAGRGCRPAPSWGPDRAVLLELEGGEALRADLHPARGWIRIVPAAEPGGPTEATIRRVHAPRDERVLALDIEAGSRFRGSQRRLLLELHTNQWNAFVADVGEGRIVSVLRAREAGDRSLRTGEPYRPPPPPERIHPDTHAREDALRAWRAILAESSPRERERRLTREFAYTGSVSAPPLVAATERSEVGEPVGFSVWWRMVTERASRPVVLRLASGRHPYPFPLPGVESEPASSILAAMDVVAETNGEAPLATDVQELADRMRERMAAAARRAERIREQLRGEEEEERARRFGDLLLANLGAVQKGAERVTLEDWDGGTLEVELDPTRSPAENAARWYDLARRHQRARERIPGLLAAAEAERDRWAERLRTLLDTGAAGPEVREALRNRSSSARRPGAEPDRLPFRSYRTSGGLDVRVGRGSADNDRLTFGHSGPNDVWLHARSVPGSHVILRWPNAEQQPPQRDLQEAAGLAAWFSRARTSGLVAVDWTRRKHVRKPRGAPAGTVIPSRVKTVFVEPDPELAGRLEAGGADGADL
jgi:predicted ribosome quality control (RQC) complex YloA/Tae2 family protein